MKRLIVTIVVLFPLLAISQTTTYLLSPPPKQQFFDASGVPLSNGFICTYAAGTTTPLVTYQDHNGTVNTNPVRMDSGGFASIWLSAGVFYKFVAFKSGTCSSGVQQWSVDYVSVQTGGGGGGSTDQAGTQYQNAFYPSPGVTTVVGPDPNLTSTPTQLTSTAPNGAHAQGLFSDISQTGQWGMGIYAGAVQTNSFLLSAPDSPTFTTNYALLVPVADAAPATPSVLTTPGGSTAATRAGASQLYWTSIASLLVSGCGILGIPDTSILSVQSGNCYGDLNFIYRAGSEVYLGTADNGSGGDLGGYFEVDGPTNLISLNGSQVELYTNDIANGSFVFSDFLDMQNDDGDQNIITISDSSRSDTNGAEGLQINTVTTKDGARSLGLEVESTDSATNGAADVTSASFATDVNAKTVVAQGINVSVAQTSPNATAKEFGIEVNVLGGVRPVEIFYDTQASTGTPTLPTSGTSYQAYFQSTDGADANLISAFFGNDIITSVNGASEPTCNAGNHDLEHTLHGGGTALDQRERCEQDAAGNYAWTPQDTRVYSITGTILQKPHTVIGICTLGTDCAVTLTNSAVFTGNTSYVCTGTDTTAAAAIQIVQASGSAFTITGSGTDVIQYICTGN